MITSRRVLAALVRPVPARIARAVPGVRAHSVHSRYAEKLASRAREQGVSVEELLERAKPKAEQIKKNDVSDLVEQARGFTAKQATRTDPAAAAATTETESVSGGSGETGEGTGVSESGNKNPTSSTTAQAEAVRRATSSRPGAMELDTFVDVAKFKLHDRKEIELLWKTRFLNTPGSFSGSMEPAPFSSLYINARRWPTFVLPLPHKAHGIELHYVQWSFVSSQTVYCLITSLAQYKLHGEYAHPHTTFMLHTDLAEKGIILTNTVAQDNQISTENAALLVLNLQRFYTAEPGSAESDRKLALLRQFNSGDRSFSVDALIEATETL